MNKDTYIRIISAVLAAFAAGCLLSRSGYYILSGAVITVTAAAVFFYALKLSGKLINPLAFFILSWVGGVGISALKLSRLQTEWSLISWLCFFLAALFFIIGYAAVRGILNNAYFKNINNGINTLQENRVSDVEGGALFTAVNIVIILSIASFLTEAHIMGYIPLLTVDTPHAYSYLHVSGLHYFTVSCVLVPSLELMWFKLYNKSCKSLFMKAELILCLFISLLIPIFLVSRFQLIFSVALCTLTYLTINGEKLPFKPKKKHFLCIAVMLLGLAAAYAFITYERAHSIEYLNGIFEMKNKNMPIFISQPYIYIANNFDNFNCLVTSLTKHSGGLRMLFPAFALTGMKFTHPELVSFPLYVTKEELTTVTLIYDAYYDFGIIGVGLMCLVLGGTAALLEAFLEKCNYRSATAVFIYAQLMFYLLFSFFTTWFSNPATWFYFIATAAIGVFLKVFIAFIRHWEVFHDR